MTSQSKKYLCRVCGQRVRTRAGWMWADPRRPVQHINKSTGKFCDGMHGDAQEVEE